MAHQRTKPVGATQEETVILRRAYWNTSGWKQPHETPAPADLSYARAAGYWFEGERVTHDSALRRLIRARSLLSLADVGAGFVASLSAIASSAPPARELLRRAGWGAASLRRRPLL